MRSHRPLTALRILCLFVLLIALPGSGGPGAGAAASDAALSPAPEAICDPPGPPPRFGCTWSLDTCDWICPICDPFGLPPRSNCTWNGDICNWVCPGYTGVDVTVHTSQPPGQNATVYVSLRSLCPSTGAMAACGGSFPVHAGTKAEQKCQAIRDIIAGQCASAGYQVTADDCATSASVTASNVGCPPTPFALGVSNDPGIFDQTENPPMPDGETDVVTGTCAATPGAVGNLFLATANGDSDLLLTWDDTANADDYIVFGDTRPDGPFDTIVGSASSGATGLSVAMPQGTGYFLVAGRNSVCGLGPKR
jgi:hypothetical protein